MCIDVHIHMYIYVCTYVCVCTYLLCIDKVLYNMHMYVHTYVSRYVLYVVLAILILKSCQYACFMVTVTPSPSSMISNTTTEPIISSTISTFPEPSSSTMMPTLNGTVIPISNDDETSMILCTY